MANHVFPLSASVATTPVAAFRPSPAEHPLRQPAAAHELAPLLLLLQTVPASFHVDGRAVCILLGRFKLLLEQGKRQNKLRYS